MLQRIRAEKTNGKNGVIFLVSMFFFELWSLNCSKTAFLQFCADLIKKPKSVKVIFTYASERSHYTLSKNDKVYVGLSHLTRDISN